MSTPQSETADAKLGTMQLTEPLVQEAGTRKKEIPFEQRKLEIDEFLDTTYEVSRNPEWAYAHFMFSHFRKSASEKLLHDRFMRQFKLFVDYEGKTWRVTGASRLGDIWLAEDFSRQHGYDRRVMLVLENFSNWRDQADRTLTWKERVLIGVHFYQMPVDISRGEIPKICNKYTSFLSRAGAPKQYLDCNPEERALLRAIDNVRRLAED